MVFSTLACGHSENGLREVSPAHCVNSEVKWESLDSHWLFKKAASGLQMVFFLCLLSSSLSHVSSFMMFHFLYTVLFFTKQRNPNLCSVN